MDPSVIEKKPISLSELNNALKKIKKRDEELSFRGQKVVDYLNSIKTVSEKEFERLFKEIEALGILRLKPNQIIKFIDLMPSSEEEIKFIANSMSLTLKKDDASKLLKVLSSK